MRWLQTVPNSQIHLASAKDACDQIGPRATPVVCDLADLDSFAAAAEMTRGLHVSLDAIIAMPGVSGRAPFRS